MAFDDVYDKYLSIKKRRDLRHMYKGSIIDRLCCRYEVLRKRLTDVGGRIRKILCARIVSIGAALHITDAQLNLAARHYSQGTEAGNQAKRRWMKKAARRGRPEAMFILGNAEIAAGHKWRGNRLLLRAARKGLDSAQFTYARNEFRRMGDRFSLGCRGYYWLNLAAENGCADAQCFMGDLFRKHFDRIPGHDEIAFSWSRMAAEQGDMDAQCKLAQLYMDGAGTEKNEALAIEWYASAMAQGSKAAQDQLNEFRSNGWFAGLSYFCVTKKDFIEFDIDFRKRIQLLKARKRLLLYPVLSIWGVFLAFLCFQLADILGTLHNTGVPLARNWDFVLYEIGIEHFKCWHTLIVFLIYAAGRGLEALYLNRKYRNAEIPENIARFELKTIIIRCALTVIFCAIPAFFVSRALNPAWIATLFFAMLTMLDGLIEWFCLQKESNRYYRYYRQKERYI